MPTTWLYSEQGRYGKAEPFFERALAIQEKVLGREHHVATTLNDLAGLLRNMNRFGEAEPLFRRALAKALGHIGWSWLSACCRIASARSKKGSALPYRPCTLYSSAWLWRLVATVLVQTVETLGVLR